MAVSSHLFIEERNNSWNTPYLFNAKELDEETGLYYYGARYYNPRTSVWLSTDPLQEKYPNISTYAYTFLNPIKYIDPDGRDPKPESMFEYKNGIFYVNLNSLHKFTRNSYLRANEDPSNWESGHIGLNRKVAEISLVVPDNPRKIDQNYTPAGIDPEHTSVTTTARTAKSTGKPDRRQKNFSTIPTAGKSKGMGALGLALFAFETTYNYLTAYWVNDDYNKIKEDQILLQNAYDIVNENKRLIPEKYHNKNDIGAIVNFVFQGENSTGDNNIGKIGTEILKSVNRYDKKTDKVKPLVQE